MKALSRRLTKLEKAEAPEVLEMLIDYSRITVEQRHWMQVMAEWLTEPGSGRWNLSKTTLSQHRMLEWLLVRCDPDAEAAGHEADCRCYYCVVPLEGILPDLYSA